MSEANVELVRRLNALANGGDWDAVFELSHPDVEFRDIQHGPDVPESFQGHEAGRLVVENWTAAYDEFGSEIYEYIDADPWVICHTRWHGKGKESGVSIDGRAADGYEVADGRVVRVILVYADVAEDLAAPLTECSAGSASPGRIAGCASIEERSRIRSSALLQPGPSTTGACGRFVRRESARG